MEGTSWEMLPGGLRLCVSAAHKFGTDAFLLSDFASPRRKDLACDLGSGCGIIPALWFREQDQAPRMAYAVELQELAYAQMCLSVQEGGLPEGRFLPVRADLRALGGLLQKGAFDLVTCNPPYKAQGCGILSREQPDRAARHETQCTVDDVCAAAQLLLKYGGRLCLCQRPERLADVICAMRAHGLEPKRLRMVHQRPDKAPWLFLIEGRLGGKPFLHTEKPLLIEGEGGFSQEVLHIYRKKQNRDAVRREGT